jgi:serine/threonine-protein kinase
MPKVCPVCGTNYADTNIFCPADGSTLRAADADGDLIGSVVADRYLVTDLLGEGGMGKVYLARHVRLPLQAAIKVLRPELLRDPASVARFNREAANASSIEHERVARVFDFGETSDGLVYLAMEYVNGPTLKSLLAQEGPLNAQRTAVIVRQVADGLDAAHRMGIVHRDLKPDNILVQKDDEGGDKCKVVDFGIAKAIGSNEKEAGLTRTGFVVGTPEFMSPEQLLGAVIDHRSDVYALALVAYQCLTLDLPFDGNTPDRGMTARLVAEPRALSVVRADLQWPAALQAVFDQALDRDPTKRTASAGAFAKAFEASLKAPAPRPAPAAPAPVAPTPSAPRPAAASAAAQVDTPGAARVITTVDKEALKKELSKSGAKPRINTPPPQRAQAPTPSQSQSGAVIDRQTATRRVPRFRLPLPSLSLVVVLAGGWWWYTKQRAPRPSDIGRLVNSATNTAGRLVEGAQGAAQSAANAAQNATSTPPTANVPSTTPAGTGATTGARPAPAAPTEPAGARSPMATHALNTLDSITKALDPSSADEASARAAVPVLQSLIARLPTGTDSTWAYIRIAEAHLLMDEVKPACTALRSARTVARSMAQAEVINRYTGQLGCGQ